MAGGKAAEPAVEVEKTEVTEEIGGANRPMHEDVDWESRRHLRHQRFIFHQSIFQFFEFS